MKVIKADLSSSGLDSLYKEVREYQRALVKRCDSFVKMLVEEGVRYAKALVPVDTGQTLMRIEGRYDPSSNKGKIWVDSEYAVFIEFGTGVIGMQNPHPDPGNWVYDTNNHGESGWWYPIKDAGVYERLEAKGVPVRKNAEGAMFGWTKGMESRPFMYETAKYLADLAMEKARVYFK